MLLLSLSNGPTHGYSLLDGLDEFGLGGLDPSAVYRLLRDMELQEWVTSTWDEEQTHGPPRRIYRLTRAGEEALAHRIDELEQSKARIESLIRAYRRHVDEAAVEGH